MKLFFMGLLLTLVNYNNSNALTIEVYGASQFEVRLHFKVDEFLIMCYLLNSCGWRHFTPLKSTLLIVTSHYYIIIHRLSFGAYYCTNWGTSQNDFLWPQMLSGNLSVI